MLRAFLGAGLWLVAGMAAAAEGKEVYFRTPSRNIYCGYMDFDNAPFIRCDVSELKPSFKDNGSCELDYGSAFQIDLKAKRGEVLCVGDTVMFPEADEIGYGESFEEGGLSCAVEKTGVTCKNAKGHGFFISKAKQKVF